MEGTEDKNCTKCKWFKSFADEYEDDLEPNDVGWCFFEGKNHYDNSPDEKDVVISDNYVCSKFCS